MPLFGPHKAIGKMLMKLIQLVAQPFHVARHNIQDWRPTRGRWQCPSNSISQSAGSSLIDEEPNLPDFSP